MDEGTIGERLVAVEDRAKSNTKRIDKLDERMEQNEKLVQSVAILAQKYERMEKDVDEIKTDVKKIVEKPAKRWEQIVEKALLVVVGAVVAFLLAKAGL